MRPLAPLELRILGVLVEKQHTVADSYPLSLNTLVLGCNQKTARDPVINTDEAEVLAALDDLKSLDLVIESSGNRVMRYEHNLLRVLRVPSQSLAILAVLVLRGPQTAAELRTATDRLHRFADMSSVEGFLDELASRTAERGGPLVAKLPRGAGMREARWGQLLGGPLPAAGPDAAAASSSGDASAAAEIASLKANQLYLRNEIALLRAQLHRLAAELGVELP